MRRTSRASSRGSSMSFPTDLLLVKHFRLRCISAFDDDREVRTTAAPGWAAPSPRSAKSSSTSTTLATAGQPRRRREHPTTRATDSLPARPGGRSRLSAGGRRLPAGDRRSEAHRARRDARVGGRRIRSGGIRRRRQEPRVRHRLLRIRGCHAVQRPRFGSHRPMAVPASSGSTNGRTTPRASVSVGAIRRSDRPASAA